MMFCKPGVSDPEYLKKSSMYLEAELAELHQLMSFSSEVDENVSSKGVAWHIDHSLKVIIRICEVLKTSDPTEYKWRPNLGRAFILKSGSIPRGKGRSPKFVVAQGEITDADLTSQWQQARTQVNTINSLPGKSFFTHQHFGMMDLKEAKKFMKIHTHHHLKIIKDIISAYEN